jgi:hypothetical protein
MYQIRYLRRPPLQDIVKYRTQKEIYVSNQISNMATTLKHSKILNFKGKIYFKTFSDHWTL